MPTTPEDIFKVADALLTASKNFDRAGKEACWRTAVSRSYYAAFTKANAFAMDRGFRVYLCPHKDLGSHEALWKWWFVEERPNDKLATFGQSLQALRYFADYKPFGFFESDKVEKAKLHAQRIFEEINFQLAEPPER